MSAYKETTFRKVNRRDIAVIGMSCYMPMAKNIRMFWDLLCEGRDCVRSIPDGRWKDLKAYADFKGIKVSRSGLHQGGYLENIDYFDNDFFGMAPKEAKLTDPNQRLLLQRVWEAIEDAGYSSKQIMNTKTGVFIGHSGDTAYKQIISDVDSSLLSAAFLGNLNPIMGSRISHILNLTGPNMLINTTCSSSLVALHMACQSIKSGESEMAIVAGVTTYPIPLRSHEIGIESSDDRARVFDDESDGTGTGEGIGVVILKPVADCRNDNIYAIIKGSSINNDGKSSWLSSPNPRAQEEVILSAWSNAGVSPETITYIEAHGTGTKVGDPIEIESLSRAFSKHTNRKQFCGIGSLKSNLGHLDEAAGIAGFIKLVLSIKHKLIPPTINFQKPNRSINFVDSPVYVVDKLQKWLPEGAHCRAGISSFGLSGTNCHLILEEWNESSSDDAKTDVFTLSAKSLEALKAYIHKYRFIADVLKRESFSSICYTTNVGRDVFDYRLAVLARDNKDLIEKIERMATTDPKAFLDNEEIFFSSNCYADTPEYGKTTTLGPKIKVDDYIDAFRNRDMDILKLICRLYVDKSIDDMRDFYAGSELRRISLPSYPFQEKRFWIDVPVQKEETTGDLENTFFEIAWVRSAERPHHYLSGEMKTILMFYGAVNLSLDKEIEAKGFRVINVTLGGGFRKLSSNTYCISNMDEDYVKLMTDLQNEDIDKIVHCCSINVNGAVRSVDELNARLEEGFFSIYYLNRALHKSNFKKNIELIVVTNYANYLNARQGRVKPENAALIGVVKTLELESARIRSRLVDIDEKCKTEVIVNELLSGSLTKNVSYRDGLRYIEEIQVHSLIERLTEKDSTRGKWVRNTGAYVIAGGAGALGLEVAKYLCNQGAKNIVILGRKDISGSSRKTSDSKLIAKHKDANDALRSMKANGCSVSYKQVDISQEGPLKEAMDSIRQEYGNICGVFNCAGVPSEGFMALKSKEHLQEIMNPKINGTWLLNNFLRGGEADFFVCFSSEATLISHPGLVDYTAANCYMDAFVFDEGIKSPNTIVINWAAWKGKGMSHEYGTDFDGVFKSIEPERGISLLDSILDARPKRVIVGTLNSDIDITELVKKLPFKVDTTIVEKLKDGKADRSTSNLNARNEDHVVQVFPKKEVVLTGRVPDKYTDTERMLADIWADVLGHTTVDINHDFFEQGGHSLLAIRFDVEVEKRGLPSIDLYSAPSISEMADVIERKKVQKK